MSFTDAHSSSAICSPSRFALLTGTYHWRRQHGIVKAFGKPFFKDTDVTIPQLLKEKGYSTACIGKWHLGWDWKFKNEPSDEVMQWGRMWKVYRPEDVDWSGSVSGGPLDRGFDYYFGDGTINFPPYAWMENDTFIQIPTVPLDINDIGFDTKEGQWGFRPGPKVEDWNPYEVLPTLTRKTVEWINKRDENIPFFLYFALPSPHEPLIPNDEFDGKSRAGGYGDFMFQTDWVVGQVLKAIKEKGLEENTIIIFSSDNGPELTAYERAEKHDHFSFLLIVSSGCTLTKQEKPLNVIILIVDDMGYGDIAAHGNPIIKTPNLDSMHDQAVRFTNFAVSPTCAPTRAALLTGKHEFLSSVTHTIKPMRNMNLESITIADIFQKKGYKTGLFGKWHLGQSGQYGPWFRGFDETLTVPDNPEIVKKMSDHYEEWWAKVEVEMKTRWGD